MGYILEVALDTHVGMVRDHNEDAISADPDAGLLILADGMGGAKAGEVASGLVIDLLHTQLVPESGGVLIELDVSGLSQLVQDVNRAIIELADQIPEYKGMGTTLVLALLYGERLMYATVGDSRLYLMRGGQLDCLTTDHTLIQELVNMDEFASLDEALDAGVPPHVLTRAMGADITVQPTVNEVICRPGDLLLLCSDGLTNMVAEQRIQEVLQDESWDLNAKVEHLIEEACGRGGDDNISVILASVNTA